MRAAHIEIRPLTEADADAVLYRDIRLEALRANPEAFGSTFEIEDAQPLSWFSARLASSILFGAFRDAKLVAIAGFAIQQGQKNRLIKVRFGACMFDPMQGGLASAGG